MQARASLALLLVCALALSGCASSGGDGDGDDQSGSTSQSGSGTSTKTGTSGSKSATSSGAPAADLPPTAALNASLASGAAPLRVNFTATGSDPEGQPVSWALSFGDNSTDGNGTALPATVSHLYKAAGSFTARLVVLDATGHQANATLAVTVTAGGALPEAQHFAGTVTGGPYVPQVGTANGNVPQATATHTFTTTSSAAKMTVVLAYAEGVAFTDLDLFIHGPGVESSSEESGPEPPVEVAAPQAGEWSIDVFAYGAEGPVDYTLDVTFS